MPARTVERHVVRLEREGYIRSKYVGGRGKRHWVAKPATPMTMSSAEPEPEVLQ
jgi:hypothetical protein